MNSSKQQLVRSFNSAANSYDRASDWQIQIGYQLQEYIKLLNPNEQMILDLGSGTGHLLKKIQTSNPNNFFIGIDIANTMLRFSQKQLTASLVCSDIESLSLKSTSIDMIVSNMVLHWCSNLHTAIEEVYRILKPGGFFIFSIPTSNSFQSLRSAWKKIDNYSHFNNFPQKEAFQDLINATGFQWKHQDEQKIQKDFDDIITLLRQFKQTGATLTHYNKPRCLIGKGALSKLAEYYKNPLNYETLTGVLQK